MFSSVLPSISRSTLITLTLDSTGPLYSSFWFIHLVDGFSISGLIALTVHLRGLLDTKFFIAYEVILGVPLTEFSFLPNGMVSCSNDQVLHNTLPFMPFVMI